jgi:hypothetical protein
VGQAFSLPGFRDSQNATSQKEATSANTRGPSKVNIRKATRRTLPLFLALAALAADDPDWTEDDAKDFLADSP